MARPLPVSLVARGADVDDCGGWLRLSEPAPPVLDEAVGDVAARMWADQERILFPHECVDIWWSVVGAETIRFNGHEVETSDNYGRSEHCAGDGDRATLEIENDKGDRLEYSLTIATLFPEALSPPFIVYWSLAGLRLRCWYSVVWRAENPRERPPFRRRRLPGDWRILCFCALALLAIWL